LRRLLGYLASTLQEVGRQEEACRLYSFASLHREDLVLLEDAYTEERYVLPGYTRAEAEKGIRAAEELLALLEELTGVAENGEGGCGCC
jgi:HEPN domain-containing protein